VFAADFDAAALENIGSRPGVVPIEIDVTRRESVEAARDQVASHTDGLDGVVNFAGILSVGSVAEIEEDRLARLLEVNVMGTFRVNQVFLPLVLARKGRIVNVSSETGVQSSMPFNGPYAMSKHAIEAYSDALRRELMLLDVAVVKLQPGPFRTGMVAGIQREFERAAKASTHFRALLERFKELTVKEHERAHDPVIVAEAVLEALTVRSPAPAYLVKPDRARALLQWMPDVMLDRLLGVFLRR